MDTRRQVLPSQRFSPADDNDYPYDHTTAHGDVIPSTRQPLSESTGNVQAHNLAALALCQQGSLSLSPPVHSIPTPPILPTQTLPSTYGTSFRSGRSLQRDASLRDSPMGYPRGSRNPIYAHKNFADYRNKVMQKELEKEEPVWPLWLEDAFLDALLLVPQMARKKFSSKAVLYGRNMLITEYLWIYHWLLHPALPGERIPDRKQRDKCNNGKPHKMFRTRKQVSSHIQVLKGFFQSLPTFHFIFPSKKDSKEDDRRFAKEDEDTESFKNNRVLIAIADGRLPDERPNYDYFARLLAADADVNLRPKQCWIFVSSSGVTLRERHVPADDGTGGAGRKQIAGYDSTGRRILSEAEYPHLRLNEDKEYKNLSCHGEPTVLLHEYTRTLTQKESCSVREISNNWSVRFPDLAEKLSTALGGSSNSSGADARQGAVPAADERTSRCVVGPCDTFHFEVVLDLHANAKFPEGSHCNGVVELAISRPDLHGHSWRSVTTVVKPDALYFDDKEPDYHDRASPVDVIPSHRVGCPAAAAAMQRAAAAAGGAGGAAAAAPNFPCDCIARGSRDTIGVRFPASSWANTFVMLAPHVSAYREEQAREREWASQNQRKGGSRSRGKQQQKDEDESTSSPSSAPQQQQQQKKSPRPDGSKKKALIDLLSEVAMYQEIWSAPNEPGNPGSAGDNTGSSSSNANGSSSGKRPAWTRRAVILWTFVPVHEKTDDKGKTSVLPPGTNWRFMSKLDPTSQYHQQRAYLSGSPAVSRDAVMSPNPSYAHHVHNAAMHEHFGAAANTAMFDMGMPPTTMGHPHHHPHAAMSAVGGGPHHLSGLNLLDAASGYVDVSACGVGSDGGLATPPPSASLQSSSGYSHAFDGGVVRGRGSIASTMSGSVDGASVVSGGGMHSHHGHPHAHHQHHLGFAPTTSSASQANDSNLVSTDPFLADLGGSADASAAVGMGASPYGDASPTDCDPNLQAWAAQGMQGLGGPGQWSYGGGDGGHQQQIATTWAGSGPDLTTGAIATSELQDHVQQWGGAGGSPTHSWGGGAEHKDPAASGVDASLWSSPDRTHENDARQGHGQDQDHQDAWAAWQALGDAGAGTPTWDEQQHHHHHHQHDGLLLGGTGLTPMRNTISRKRSRCESLDDSGDDDIDGEKSYHVSSLRRKLSHHGGGSAAPTAVMGDGFQL